MSTLVVLRRLLDIDAIDRGVFDAAYAQELRLIERAKGGGGDFYRTLRARVGKRFGQALTDSTLAGRTSFSECFRLLAIHKSATLHDFATSLATEP